MIGRTLYDRMVEYYGDTDFANIAMWLDFDPFEHDWTASPLLSFNDEPRLQELIKAKLRELKLSYQLDWSPDLDPSGIGYDFTVIGIGEWTGSSVGNVLVQCALALIEKGVK